jgi:tripartite-type tricarboxylate transporter receptor subunit TctC
MKVMQWLPILAVGAGLGAAHPSAAQEGADFYKGKTVTYIVATAPGGGYDTYGRLITEYMQKYLPGSTFVVRNMPGAGHLIGANAIYAARPDGLTMGTFNTGLIYNQLMGSEGVKFDMTKMSWIGKAGSEPRVVVCAPESPIKTFEDLRAQKEPVKFAVSGVGSSNYVETTIFINALKLPIRMVTGYNGNEDQMAIRRGEITCGMGSRSSFDGFVKNGYGHYIAQVGGSEKDVRQLRDLVTDPAAKELVALIQSQGDIARLTAGPPGIPKDRLDALRAAYRKALEDPELQARAAKLDRPVDPAYGDAVLNAVKEALSQKPETIALLKQATEKPKEAPAAAGTKGTVAELKNDGREIVLNLPDGKTFAAAISGSRTEITVAGQKGDRTSIKSGMTCTVDAAGVAAEAKTIICN